MLNDSRRRSLIAFHFVACLLGAFCVAQGTLLQAAVPTDPAARALAIGQPVEIRVQPAALALTGPRALQQLVVTGRYQDGSQRDLTHFCEYQLQGARVLDLVDAGFVAARENGAATLRVSAGGQTATVAVRVEGMQNPDPVSFRRELIAALNVGGCNQGACHGTPSGKNGFKLSLRGYDPAADYLQLTRDVLARRTDRQQPEASLILQKALGRVPHEGGARFTASSVAGTVLQTWLREGLRDDQANLPALQGIEVVPGPRMLTEPARWQQLAVLARYADGKVRDVTRLTVFTSSETSIADVSATGLVEFQQSGEIAVLCRYLDQLVALRLTYLQPRKGFQWPNPPENNYVDKLVFNKLKMLNIPPSDLCTDQEFIRRAYLDIGGILPTSAEVRAFLADSDQAKRARLVDRLLERPEYADFWTLKWADILRSNRKTLQVKGVHVFQHWLHDHIEKNTPLDRVIRELLTAQGSTFANPAANFYRVARDPTSLAETTAQLFFGIRMQCAKCHNHPFERWTQDDYYSMAAFFARVKLKKDRLEPGAGPQGAGAAEYIYADRAGEVTQPRTNQSMPPRYMGGSVATVTPGQDRRDALAKWLTSPENPFLARSIVNRIWYHLIGRGIVDPVDDFRDSNPSANDELLAALAREFVSSGFNIKQVIRTIANSRTYQLSAQANDLNKDDAKYFSHAVTRLMTAEQMLDAICQATEVPEKFADLPLGTRATQLPDGEVNHVFLKTFGQPARELACECERENDSNLAQALQLINGATINDKVRAKDNRLSKLLATKLTEKEIIGELYMATLSRSPVEGELRAALDHVTKGTEKRKAWEDVHWALLNSKEFLFRH